MKHKLIPFVLVILFATTATAQNVGVGTNSPASKLDVTGSFGTAVTTATTSVTLDGTYSTIMASAGITLTLPTAASAPRRIYTIVFNASSGTAVTIARSGSDNISNAGATSTSYSLSSGSVTLQSDGVSKWYATVTPLTSGSTLPISGGTGITIGTGNVINSLWTASSSNIYNNNSGNVMIGSSTANPQQSVSIITPGGLYTNAEHNPHGIGIMTGQTTSDYILYMGADATNAVGYIQSVHYGTAIANMALNARGGLVGIGTATPQTTLEVSAAATDVLKVTSTLGGTGNHSYIDFVTYSTPTNNYVNGRIGTVDMGTNNGSLVFEVGNQSAASATTTERMRILNTGALAINGATNYGTTGNTLMSNGNGPPTWNALNLAGGSNYVSGILPVANGGTGSSTQGWVDLTTNQTAAGIKTWSSNANFGGTVTMNGTTQNTNQGLEWYYGTNDRYGMVQSSGGGMTLYTSTNYSSSFISFTLSGTGVASPGSPSGSLGTELMRITHGGYVGIGTSSPTSMFSVGSSSQFQVSSSGAIAAATGIVSSGTIQFSSLSTLPGYVYANSSGVLSIAGTSTTLPIQGGTGITIGANNTINSFWTLNGNNIYNNNNSGNGYVGVGTSTPQTPVEVTANATDVLKVTSTIGGAGNHAYIDFSTFATATNNYLDARIGAIDMNNNNGGIVFETGNQSAASGTTTERMRILNTGLVGIGTTTPGSLLSVMATAATGGGIKMSTSNNAAGDQVWLGFDDGSTTTDANDRARVGVNIATGGNGRLVFTTGAGGSQTQRMIIDESGNVGIGVAALSGGSATTATALLDVTNSTTSDTKVNFLNTNTSSGNVGLELRAGGASAQQYIDFAGGSTSNTGSGTPDFNNRIISSPTALIHSTSAVANGIVLLNGGNVGIGTATPSSLFSVGSSSQFQVNSSGAIAAATGIVSSGTIQFSGLSTLPGFVYANASGVLSIGGTSATLPIQGGTGITIGANNTINSYWTLSGSTLINNNSGGVTVSAGATQAVLTANGTNNPEIILQSSGAAKLEIAAATSAAAYIANSAIGDVTIRQTGAQKILFSTASNGSTNDLTLSGGSVGIGTSAPSQTLTVNGNALFGVADNTSMGIDAQAGARLGFYKKSGYLPEITAASGDPIIFSQTNQADIFTNISGATLTEFMRITPTGALAFNGAANYGTAGNTLMSNGNGIPSWSALNLAGGSAYVTGILPIANGGTGSSTQGWVDLTTNQTAAGVKTWSSNAIFSGGTVSMNNGTSNMLSFNSNGVAVPSYTTSSVGTKILLYPQESGTTTDYAIGIAGSTLWQTVPGNTSTYLHAFYGGTTELMRIRGDGNVGIASTAPATYLQLGNTNNSANSYLTFATGNNSQFRTWQIGVPYGSTTTTSPNYGFVITDAGTSTSVTAASTPFMIDFNTHNVGIGTITPSTTLHVSSTTTAATFDGSNAADGVTVLTVRRKDVTGRNINFIPSNYDGTNTWQEMHFAFSSPAGTQTTRFTGGSEYAFDGNVGVQTTLPIATLDVLGQGTARTGTAPTTPSVYFTGGLPSGQSGPASGDIEFRHYNQTEGIGFGYQAIFATGTNTNQALDILSRGTGNITLNAYSYSTGNVGIGTASPAEKLEVNGNIDLSYGAAHSIYNVGGNGTNGIAGYDLTVAAGNSNTGNGAGAAGGNLWLTAGNTNSAGGQAGGCIEFTVGKNYWNNGANANAFHGDFIFNGGKAGQMLTSYELMRLNGTTGYLGLGTSSPNAPLHVAQGTVNGSGITTATLTREYFNSGSGTGGFSAGSSGSGNIMVQADGYYWANGGGYVATSDERIKDVIGQSDPQSDLGSLLRIRVTDYRYKDAIAHDHDIHKKVIAQQLQEVYPQAVQKHNTAEFIPNIYQDAVCYEVNGGMITIQLADEVCDTRDIKIGAGCKLYMYDRASGMQKEIKGSVTAFDSKSITVKPAKDLKADEYDARMFVYGTEIHDLLSVDYEAISMLNVSATQELARQLREEQAKNKALEEKNKMLEQQISDIHAENKATKSDMDKMKASIETMQQILESKAQK